MEGDELAHSLAISIQPNRRIIGSEEILDLLRLGSLFGHPNEKFKDEEDGGTETTKMGKSTTHSNNDTTPTAMSSTQTRMRGKE